LIVTITLLAAALLIWRRLVESDALPTLSRYVTWLSGAWYTRAALGLALAILLLPALVWSGVSLAQGNGGTLPHAGPTATISSASTALGGGSSRGRGGGFRQRPNFGNFPGNSFGDVGNGFPGGDFGGGGFGGFSGAGDLSSAVISYLEANQGTAKYLVAVSSANQAASIILATGKPVMALGGFTGSDPILTLTQLQALIREGQVRYFLVGGGGFGGVGGGGGNGSLLNWVASNCTAVSGASGLYSCAR
jgi:hypothetical protein